MKQSTKMRNREPAPKGWGLSGLSFEALAKSEAKRARRNWEPACRRCRLRCGTERSAATAKKCEMRRHKKSPHRPNHTKADGVKRKGREHYGSDMLIFMFMQTKCQHNRETRIIFPVCSCISVEKNPPLTRHKNNQWVLKRLSGTL